MSMELHSEAFRCQARYAVRHMVRTHVDVVGTAAERCANRDRHVLHDLRTGWVNFETPRHYVLN